MASKELPRALFLGVAVLALLGGLWLGAACRDGAHGEANQDAVPSQLHAKDSQPIAAVPVHGSNTHACRFALVFEAEARCAQSGRTHAWP